MYYIDPGTGSMLFTVLIGIVSAGFYMARSLFLRLRYRSKGEKQAQQDAVPFAVFSDDKRYFNVFAPICAEMDRRGQRVDYYTASRDDPAFDVPYKHVRVRYAGDGNRAFAKMNFLKADVLLSTTPGLNVYQWKRSPDVKYYVHIPHAASDITLYRMFGLDAYDAVLLSGDYQIAQLRRLEALRHQSPKELEVVGIVYMDEMKKRLDALPPRQAQKKTVLVAPSWGKSALLTAFGKDFLDALIQTDYNIIIRPHPQSYKSEKEMLDALMAAYPANERLIWDQSNDNFDVLHQADILISDFSGVLFDFSLVFDKPLLYADTTFDPAPYDAWWLNEPLWTFETLPKIGVKLQREHFPRLQHLLDGALNSAELKAARDEARQQTWAHPLEATQRVCDYLIRRQQALHEKHDR